MTNSQNHGGNSQQAVADEVRRLQAKMASFERERARQNADYDDENPTESQPLAQTLWDAKVPEGFKSPHLPTFDGKTDPLEHLMAVGTQTVIIGAPEHLKCK
ncbi:hypothetical protein A2U01_0061647, partial [Trifolium medium]|nr:hypothetical protein [Trifolium medium]